MLLILRNREVIYMEHIIKEGALEEFRRRLIEEEKCSATIEKYLHDVRNFLESHNARQAITKENVILYKQKLIEQQYAITTVNGILASLNNFLKKMNWNECIVKSLKTQRAAFRSQERELSKQEYYRLLNEAKRAGNLRLYYLMQTICSTGIWVSELRFITWEALCENAGVERKKVFPHNLRHLRMKNSKINFPNFYAFFTKLKGHIK